MSEKQAITLAKRNKLEVTQTQTARYKKTGVIPTGDPLKAFIKTLEQLFETVTLATDKNGKVLSGKKRQYVCTNRLKGVAKRDDKRSADFSKSEQDFKDAIMTLLYHKHQNDDTKSYTIKHWAFTAFGLKIRANEEMFNSNLFNSLTYNNDEAYQQLFNSKSILSDLYSRYTDTTRNLIEKTFKALEADGLIKTMDSYTAVTSHDGVDNSFKIDKLTHVEATEIRSSLVKKHFGSHAKFAKVYNSDHADDVAKSESFKQTVIDAVGFYYSFKNVAVEVIKPKEVTAKKYKEARIKVTTSAKQNFLDKIKANRNIEAIMGKWDGTGAHPMGFVTNVFAIELTELLLASKTTTVEFKSNLIDAYVASFNANLNVNLSLTKKRTKQQSGSAVITF